MIKLRNKLKKFREDVGYTQQSLANEIGINKVAYNYLETGRRDGTPKTWIKIKKALGLTNDELVEAMEESIFLDI